MIVRWIKSQLTRTKIWYWVPQRRFTIHSCKWKQHTKPHTYASVDNIFVIYCVLQDDDQESVVMPKKNGDKFLCYLPKVEKSKSEKTTVHENTTSLILETEKRFKLKTPDELLEALKERCFLRVSSFTNFHNINLSFILWTPFIWYSYLSLVMFLAARRVVVVWVLLSQEAASNSCGGRKGMKLWADIYI